MTILSEFKKIKEDTGKLSKVIKNYESEYDKNHSNCCDAKIVMGICMACKEHTVSQQEE